MIYMQELQMLWKWLCSEEGWLAQYWEERLSTTGKHVSECLSFHFAIVLPFAYHTIVYLCFAS